MTNGQKKKLSKMLSKIEGILAQANEMKDKMEESFESKSDNWKEGEKGQEAEEAIGQMYDVILGLEQAESAIGNIDLNID